MDKIPRLTQPDALGRKLHILELSLDAVNGQVADGEPEPRSPMDPANAYDFRGWHKPQVRGLVAQLEREYGIEATSMTSFAMPSFSAYLANGVVEMLQSDRRVERLLPVYEANDFSQVPPWANQVVGGETIPWGKIAIGTNDAIGADNIVFMIDAGMPPAHGDLLNVVPAPIHTDNPAEYIISTAHASHVAGILSAAMNGVMVRGVNPGAAIINVNRGRSDASIRESLDWVLACAEYFNIFAVANISSNSERWSETSDSGIAKYMRRLSTRVLVVQSAGNQRGDACDFAYGPANANDGILVVSGIDEDGRQPAPFDNSASGWPNEPGANWGNCVEMWAPSQRVLSTWDTSSAATMVLSGTSMAAPHVAALAARFGTSSTTPVERENHVRARLRGTGFQDQSGSDIVVPSYLQPAGYVVAPLLTAVSTYASTVPGFPPPMGTMYTAWISGQFPPSWIEIDLGWIKNLVAIRLTPAQSPGGPVTHYIYAGNSPSPMTLVQTISENGDDLEPFACPLVRFGPASSELPRCQAPPGWDGEKLKCTVIEK
ncbi:MAG: S8 family serine peptidase [Betaproteobacteria bacterium]|nr:S8 family serine peptidase [Betaproteobacteria bacterium]